jgi:hypothetical protein
MIHFTYRKRQSDSRQVDTLEQRAIDCAPYSAAHSGLFYALITRQATVKNSDIEFQTKNISDIYQRLPYLDNRCTEYYLPWKMFLFTCMTRWEYVDK